VQRGMAREASEHAVTMALTVFRRADNTVDHDALAQTLSCQKPLQPSLKPHLSILEDFALGTASSASAYSLFYPLDKIKARIMTQGGEGAVRGGIFAQASQIVKQEGVAYLWRGLGTTTVLMAPDRAVGMAANSFFVRHVSARLADGHQLSLAHECLAGALTGFANSMTTHPVERVKILLQMQGRPGYPVRSSTQVIRELGLAGLYKGLPVCMLRDVPFAIIFFSVYAQGKQAIAARASKPVTELTPLELLASGTLAGAMAAGLDSPADCIKTRYQAAAEGHYKGIVDCFRRTVSAEGYGILMAAAPARALLWAPVYGISFTLYESLHHWLWPYKRVKYEALEQDMEILRRARMKRLQRKLALKYDVHDAADAAAPAATAASV
jgi:solute carrier family 25 aspartate/glutamate transporter 12/13